MTSSQAASRTQAISRSQAINRQRRRQRRIPKTPLLFMFIVATALWGIFLIYIGVS